MQRGKNSRQQCVNERKQFHIQNIDKSTKLQIHLRERDYNKIRSVDMFGFHEVSDKSNSLDGFAKTHFISQDPIKIVVVERYQPF